MRHLMYFLCALLLPSIVAAQSLEGRAQVIDGDTIALEGLGTRIRLYGIDAPEGRQTCQTSANDKYLCGPKSAEALQGLVGRNGRAICEQTDRDRYGRVVAVCKVDGRDLGAELVRQGWAIEYVRYLDGRYTANETDARRAKRGLWAGRFVMPWDWRRGERDPA
ncbi:MAG: nuclease [Microvirga sp.]|jgi:endonuclease YncB( thermonuclease family)|nr:nuclease [Microvirga sp.]